MVYGLACLLDFSWFVYGFMCLLDLGSIELIPNCTEVEKANASKSLNDELPICLETTIDGFIRLENSQMIFKYLNILFIFFKSPKSTKRYV